MHTKKVAFKFSATSGLLIGGRSNQEDSLLVDVDQGVFGVFDGMGGYSAGDVASATLRDLVAHQVSTPGSTFDQLRTHISKMNLRELKSACKWDLDLPDLALSLDRQLAASLRAKGLKTRVYGSPGTTMVLSWAQPLTTRVVWCTLWLGDSRAYLGTPGKGMKAITKDHSQVQSYLDIRPGKPNSISHTQAFTHPDKNRITAFLPNIAERDGISRGFSVTPLSLGQRLLLTSDGLTDELMRPELRPPEEDNYKLENTITKFFGNPGPIDAQVWLDNYRDSISSWADNHVVVIVDVLPGDRKLPKT